MQGEWLRENVNHKGAKTKQVSLASDGYLPDVISLKKTQAQIATLLGVSQQTVSAWLTPITTSGNRRKDKTGKKKPNYDSRVTVGKDAHSLIYQRFKSGEPQAH